MKYFLIFSYILFGYIANADTVITDPVFKPPQITTAARPTCPSTFGCFGYNTDLKKFEWNDGSTWQALGTGLIEEWTTGKSYKVGQLLNGGIDKNWINKVEADHTSTVLVDDANSNKLRPLAPPIITTGIQSGGVVSLAGTTATVQSGAGFIATYLNSPSPFPLLKFINWNTQNITLPATGIFSLFIDNTGTLISISGFSTSLVAQQNISVGIVDMYLGLAFDRETYPTNPVGQLMSMSLFFGGMTKGLSYSATGLQLTRTAHQIYFWGANSSDPYDPNVKSAPALTPSTFYEYTSNGAVLPITKKINLRTGVYDNNGTLVNMSGNTKWGFARIYSTLGVDDYVMYSQAEYPTEADANTAAVSPSFIKPIDLTLTKFSAWVSFKRNDADLSDNVITTCEPFGCDKIGTSSGGGGGGGSGGGDVFGPAISNQDNITTFADASGKVIKDSGVAIANIPTMNANGGVGMLLQTSAANKALSSSGIAASQITTNATNITTLQTNSHTHANKALLDTLTTYKGVIRVGAGSAACFTGSMVQSGTTIVFNCPNINSQTSWNINAHCSWNSSYCGVETTCTSGGSVNIKCAEMAANESCKIVATVANGTAGCKADVIWTTAMGTGINIIEWNTNGVTP